MGQITTAPFDTDLWHQSIDQLKSFCRGEMSAVEAYEQAIAVTKDPRLLQTFRRNWSSHQRRVALLCQRIRALGGDPPQGSGPWGTFVKAVEGTAAAVGERPALSMLEQGEGHGLRDYKSDRANLDLESRRLVDEKLVPEQVLTQTALTDLERSVS
jgi:hypothetical protein